MFVSTNADFFFVVDIAVAVVVAFAAPIAVVIIKIAIAVRRNSWGLPPGSYSRRSSMGR